MGAKYAAAGQADHKMLTLNLTLTPTLTLPLTLPLPLTRNLRRIVRATHNMLAYRFWDAERGVQQADINPNPNLNTHPSP